MDENQSFFDIVGTELVNQLGWNEDLSCTTVALCPSPIRDSHNRCSCLTPPIGLLISEN